MDSIEKLCDEVEKVNEFCYLVDRLNSSSGCEAVVTARPRCQVLSRSLDR